MKKVLCIVSAMNAGGAETFLMKIYRSLDRTRYQMDFCVNAEQEGVYDREIEALGGRIFRVTPKSKGPIKSFIQTKNLVKREKYQYVMRVNQHSLAALDLLAARMGGAKHLILRSSNSRSVGTLQTVLHYLFRFLPRMVPTVKIAPSTEAAEYTFGKGCVTKNKVTLLKNGLDTEKFRFSAEARHSYRAELGVENRLVVGHVGRFDGQKNHGFLLEVFAKIKQLREDAVLILVGDGKDRQEMSQKAKDLGVADSVQFLGVRSDVPELLSAMDVFVFPSLYEGMPNTVLEAQTSGLPCVVSDTITGEAKVTELVHFLSLNQGPDAWAELAIAADENRCVDREAVYQEMRHAGYDAADTGRQFVALVFDD